MKPHMYTDREYLDMLFKEQNEKLVVLTHEVEILHKKIVGNGEKGLADIAKENSQSITWIVRAIVMLSGFIFLTHLEPAAKFVTDLIKHNL